MCLYRVGWGQTCACVWWWGGVGQRTSLRSRFFSLPHLCGVWDLTRVVSVCAARASLTELSHWPLLLIFKNQLEKSGLEMQLSGQHLAHRRPWVLTPKINKIASDKWTLADM